MATACQVTPDQIAPKQARWIKTKGMADGIDDVVMIVVDIGGHAGESPAPSFSLLYASAFCEKTS